MVVVDDIRDELKRLGLDTRGNKHTLKERLRKYRKKENKATIVGVTGGQQSATLETTSYPESTNPQQSLPQANQEDKERENGTYYQPLPHINSRYDYYLCFDVEATCELGFRFEFPSEIIEFPVVLLDGSTLEIVDEFQSYVKPTHRPVLSDFCKELTGISQETVDNAPTFVEVLALFEEWLTSHGIILDPNSSLSSKKKSISSSSSTKVKHKGHGKGGGYDKHNPSNLQVANAVDDFRYGATFCFITDGPFDIRDFVSKQCLHSNILRPSYFAQPYIDVRTMFRDYFDLVQWMNIEHMLGFLGETFQGRQHSGICDARMVGLIAQRLAQGFRKEENDPIFSEDHSELVAPQWNEKKIEKFRSGCVLKANRSTSNTFIKMISFKKVAQIEALPSAIAAGRAAGPLPPKQSSKNGNTKDGGDDEANKDNKKGGSASTINAASLPSPPESESTSNSPIAETFVSESKFSALTLSSE
ncbi:hypothetical protein FBU30_010577 [Linnemannia zychae]|nr:hypothetical protein FBU30_010577 [Linnemannia zychae]